MVFPLRQVIKFAMSDHSRVDVAYRKFFGDLPFSMLKKQWEELFLEWLIFDFRDLNSPSFLTKYFLKNPDNFEKDKLDQFEQIVQTHFYSQFEIADIKRGQWIVVEDLFTGKKYKVFEKKGSETLENRGVIPGRIAKVDGKWYLVGANSVYFPITYTERAKKNMRKIKVTNYSPRDTVELLRSQDNDPTPPINIPTKK